jgi:hypothetical protein
MKRGNMAKLNLKTKKPPLKIDRKISFKDNTYIPINDPANFYLLKDNRCEYEKFSRIDKFFVNHYFKIGTEWLCEKIFYPSKFGFEEINFHEFEENEHPLKPLCNKLINNGVGLIGERPVPEIYKKQKRIKLKCKPTRMKLTCKEED